MAKILSLGVLFSLVALIAACGVTPTPQTASGGNLEGKVTIGPLTPGPVRAGQPTPTPSPAACTARGLMISNATTGAQVMSLNFQPDCTYRIGLPAGTYTVRLKPNGIDRSSDLPKTVVITNGQTVHLDIAIDTGIR